MTHPEQTPKTDTQVWSAYNLPRPKPSRMMRFSALAVAIGLVTIVLASAVKDPIRTSGTMMEPPRFTASAQQGIGLAKAAATARSLVVASDAP